LNYFDIFQPVLAAGGLIDLPGLIKTFGYLGIIAIIFAESGLFFGFFLPGDSLLFTAGVVASGALLPGADGQPLFNIWLLAGLCFVAAVAGDSVGYWFGKKVGPKIFSREDSLLFRKTHILKAQSFYEKHGGKTIVLARFLPIVRTFAPIVAGVGRMKYASFLAFNLVGGFGWAVGLTFLGFLLGNAIPPEEIDKYLLPLIALIILISVLPTAFHILKEKENRDQIAATFRKLSKRSSQ
jgi:membrane-associated protein